MATPMAALLSDCGEADRLAVIKSVVLEIERLSDPAMLEGGRFSFPQEAYVGTAGLAN
jgi:hypothetical protein